MACSPDKRAQNVPQDYIINAPDFEELERQKAERLSNAKHNKQKKPTLSKEDSMKAYIKELTHHFHLQEKQMKALEYIYAKYDKKETQSIQFGDTAQLAKLNAEKEKSIAVVLGENFYARKGAFDRNYGKKIVQEKVKSIKLSNYDNIYLSALATKLKLPKDKKEALKLLIFDSKQQMINKSNDEVAIIKRTQNAAEKKLLGDVMYFRKVAFDKTHNDYQNRRNEISTLKPITIRTMRTLNFGFNEAKGIEEINEKFRKRLKGNIKNENKITSIENEKAIQLTNLLGEYAYTRYQYFIGLFSSGLYDVSQGNIWLNKADTEYLKALSEKLKLTENEIEDLEICIYHFNNLKEDTDVTKLEELKAVKLNAEKSILGDDKYNAKVEFDKSYNHS